mgnify:CR=1 FL=1
MEWPDDWPVLSTNLQYFLIASVTFFSCIAMLASIGYGIVMERDWIPQVFQGELLTSVNAWVRRIDQTAMLLGPLLASAAISFSPWFGGLIIATWNVVSLFIEMHVMRKIYNKIPSLQEPKDISASSSKTELKRGLVDWVQSWRLWVQSPVCVPGIALAILYTNIFQLSFLAQAFATSHCVSTIVIAGVYIFAGVCGFAGNLLGYNESGYASVRPFLYFDHFRIFDLFTSTSDFFQIWTSYWSRSTGRSIVL